MLQHTHFHRGDAAGLGGGQPGAIAAVHHAHRQIEDQIHQPGPGHLGDQLFQLGPTPDRVRISAKSGKKIAGRMADPTLWARPVVLNARLAISAPWTDVEQGGSSENRRKRLLFRAQRRGFKESI